MFISVANTFMRCKTNHKKVSRNWNF